MWFLLPPLPQPLSPPCFPLSPDPPPLSVSLQKRAVFPETSIKHGIRCHNNARYIPPNEDNPVGGNGSHEQAEESETASTPIVRSPTRIPS